MNQPADSSAPAETTPATTPVKRVRRISSKPAKTAPAPSVDEPTDGVPAAPARADLPEPPDAQAPKHSPTASPEPPEPKPAPWAEPDVSEGAVESAAKRKRKRRRKGKGGASQQQVGSQPLETPGEPDAPVTPTHAPVASAESAREPSSPPKPHMPRAAYDPTAVSKMAWKLYQGEIGEEGIALIDDHDARDLARRCFRLAEIFLDEQTRRGR